LVAFEAPGIAAVDGSAFSLVCDDLDFFPFFLPVSVVGSAVAAGSSLAGCAAGVAGSAGVAGVAGVAVVPAAGSAGVAGVAGAAEVAGVAAVAGGVEAG
jgi:hypothetical protein